MHKIMPCGMLILCMGITLATSQVNGSVKSWTFDSDPQGGLPEGWVGLTGVWRVEPAPDAPSAPNVFSQTSESGKGGHFNVTTAREPLLKDLELSVKLRALEGQEDQGGGLVWRFRDLKNYYIARHNPLENNYRVYKVVDGRRTQLASADVEAPAKVWHEMKVTMKGPLIQCYLDGKMHLTVEDQTFTEGGHLGLWTKADARTQFDDLHAEGE